MGCYSIFCDGDVPPKRHYFITGSGQRDIPRLPPCATINITTKHITTSQRFTMALLLVKMRSITKAPIAHKIDHGPSTVIWKDKYAISNAVGALFLEYLTMATAYFHDDIMCRRKRGGVWRQLSSITTSAAAPPSLMIWTKDFTAWWRYQAPRNSIKYPLKIHSQ